jgi:hypothetical protein
MFFFRKAIGGETAVLCRPVPGIVVGMGFEKNDHCDAKRPKIQQTFRFSVQSQLKTHENTSFLFKTTKNQQTSKVFGSESPKTKQIQCFR